jgi:hypothetical protein
MDWEGISAVLLQTTDDDYAFVREAREIRRICSDADTAIKQKGNFRPPATKPSIAAIPTDLALSRHDGYPLGPMPSFQVEVRPRELSDIANTVMFDLLGAQLWGERPDYDNYADDPRCLGCTDYLVRLSGGDFVLLTSVSYLFDNRTGWYEVRRVASEEAAKWLVFGKFAVPDDLASLADMHRFPACADRTCDNQPTIASTSANTIGQLANRSVEPSEDMRQRYQDPSNYWRNVWLYELREHGMTMDEIVRKLVERGKDFYEIYEHNAIRSALKSIADHHGWPRIRGKPGPRKGGK